MKYLQFIVAAIALATGLTAEAWRGMDMPELHVQGRDLVDNHGNKVILHGFAQTYSPWFNEQGTKWTNYDVEGCLKYNKGIIDGVLDAGWEVNFLRLHMDPYWSNKPGEHTDGESDIHAFDFNRFKTYLDKVFVPMAKYAISNGLYVVMRPPGVCPEQIAVGDDYQKYLLKVWGYVAQHSYLKNNPNIMFELANEPIHILGTDGTYSASGAAAFSSLHDYFQAIVDEMRSKGCHNILWVPGLAYQASYSGFADYPIEGENIGYAVHIYPGWFGSNEADGYPSFKKGWDKDIKPAADFAPIMVTEMDWAPESYGKSWGKGITGDETHGFGANFMRLCDESGNASWLLFTGGDLMDDFVDVPGTPGNYTFLNDPEACPWPIYHKFQEYKNVNYPRPDYTRTFSSDRGDGMYDNPVIYSDFPDPDVIRVGDTYYMLSTTMFLMPGATIMRSYDLVNWEYCSNPLESIENTDAYSLINGENRYARGQWASALQYKDGKFYLLFNTNDDGAYLMTAEDAEGPWTKTKLNRGFYDCGLLFDGDDTYVVSGINHLTISKVDENFTVLESKEVVVRDDSGLEGSHLYHIGDYYYIYATYGGIPGKQVVFRSKDIFGSYEEKVVLASSKSVHQGALVDTDRGDWYTILFRDQWPWGRLPYLLPIDFDGGWPIPCNNDGEGDVWETVTKPYISTPKYTRGIATNDVFRHYELGKQWEWNHNPDASKWSLMESAGWLRLRTASVTDNFYEARNTLTQRMFGWRKDKANSYGTIRMDISHMANGEKAGLSVMQDPQACIGVKMDGGVKRFFWQTSSLTGKIAKKEIDGIDITAPAVYLRAVASFVDGTVKFYYSTDNVTYTQLGDTFTMQYDLSVFVGNRWAIFNYNTKTLDGYVDIDWFSTEPEFSENKYYDPNFEGYSKKSLTVSSLEVDARDIVLMMGSSASVDVTARFEDGHTANVSTAAEFTSSNPEVVSVKNGRITGNKEGKATVTITYVDPLKNKKTLTISVICQMFPLVEGLFNPSIYATGTFDESTHTVTTGQYGFAGWYYGNGLNLGDYKYLVAKISKTCNGLSFRIFDENNYWAGAAEKSLPSGKNYIMYDLKNTTKADGSRKIDPSHLFYVGFWTYGGSPFVIDEVYATNCDDYLNPTDALQVLTPDDTEEVTVCSLDGIVLMENVTRRTAIETLPSGIYVIGNKKVRIVR